MKTRYLFTIIIILSLFNCNSKMHFLSKNVVADSLEIKDNYDYFKDMLNICLPNFYEGNESRKTYFTNKKIVIVEYKFKDSTKALNSYIMVEKLVNEMVNLKRRDFHKRCYPILDENAYFVKIHSLSIFLFTYQGNITYESGDSTINDYFLTKEGCEIKKFVTSFKNW